jgi:predicted ArsR family transcriptional regulator
MMPDMASPMLERAKIQAQVLVPLLRTLRKELGEARANQIVWKALADWRRDVVRELHQPFDGAPGERWAEGQGVLVPDIGDAVDMQPLALEPDRFEFDITGCRFADFFRELGEPELGFALLCEMDTTIAEEIGGDDVGLERTSTIMQGASRCDFRFALRRAGLLEKLAQAQKQVVEAEK